MFKQTLLASAALAFGSSSAIAASQFHTIANRSAKPLVASSAASLAPNLYGVIADFGAQPPGDDWPCFGGEADCGSIAPGGLVIGSPSFLWPLASCDAKTTADNGTCTQIFWAYADYTTDTTDDLIFSVVVTQGRNTILQASSDEGPNPFAGDGVVFVYGDFAFGTIGNPTGPGNGWCDTVTCTNPKEGLADVVIKTSVGTYSATQKFQVYFYT